MTDLVAPSARFNFAQYLFGLNRARGSKAAFVDAGGSLSYAELEMQSRRFAAALLKAGMRREERVLISMLDCHQWAVAFLGSLYAGVVPVCVNTLLHADMYAYMLEHSHARAVFTSTELLPAIRPALAQPRGSRLLVIAAGAATDGATPFEQFMDVEPLEQPEDTSVDDIAFWLYSSGSTGTPKGVVHTHGNLYWTCETYGKHVLRLRESDVTFSAAKLFFAYGLGNGLSFPLAAGATCILMPDRPTPAAVYKILREHQVTVFFGVPTLYASMLVDADRPRPEQLALRLCTSAGEPLSESLGVRFHEEYDCHILDGIGSTEMLHIFLCNREEDVHYGTTGVPVPGYDISLRADDGETEVPDGEIGDLFIRGESAALMYWTDRVRSRRTFLGPWLKSGDKYYRNDQGYYVYCGRSDDMLKVSGQYVSPAEVESVLISHDAVLEAAVVGVADDDGLMKMKAFVVLKQGHAGDDPLVQKLRDYIKGHLAPHKAPRQFEFVAELPKTATGKIQRFRLREREQKSAAA